MDKKKTPKTQGLETVPEENLNNSAEDKKPIQSGNDLATWLQNRLEGQAENKVNGSMVDGSNQVKTSWKMTCILQLRKLALELKWKR